MDGVTHGDILHSDVRHITFPNTVIQSPAFTIFPHSTLGKTRIGISFNATSTIAAATVGKTTNATTLTPLASQRIKTTVAKTSAPISSCRTTLGWTVIPLNRPLADKKTSRIVKRNGSRRARLGHQVGAEQCVDTVTISLRAISPAMTSDRPTPSA